ncbi:hypothetical protein BDV93DRAFT_521012 [Ceratobasidium sp. AG-I]|nr:hypothetical protein BDV93DRAFT_521012 [Ceratobasidium sp. AG-I]
MAAPIDRLPPEILSRIFVTLVQASLYAASIGDGSYNTIQYSSIAAAYADHDKNVNYPVRLTSVCIRWRQVAISTPLLWSFLDLVRSWVGLRNLQYLNMCYDRSVDAPLSVRLGKYSTQYCQDGDEERLAPLLSSYAPRLYSLAIAYSSPGVAKKALSFLVARGTAGRLRKLALRAYLEDNLILADDPLPQDALDELLEPLHSLHLDCVAFNWDITRCRNLVELQLVRLLNVTTPSSSQLVSFLNANPTIRKLKISCLSLSTYDPGLPPIKLPELQNMELDISLQFTEWFFTLLTPGTRDITLLIYCYAPGSATAQVVDTFRQFFQRSRIVTLRMHGGCLIPFSSIAAYLPHLETLGAANVFQGYDLSSVDAQTELLPRLHTVELVYCTIRDVESSLKAVLSLPSVRQIRFPYFLPGGGDGPNVTDIDQVGEWMRGRGITANPRKSPELNFPCSPSPFL